MIVSRIALTPGALVVQQSEPTPDANCVLERTIVRTAVLAASVW